MEAIGRTRWVIPEGYIPAESMVNANEELLSHEAACILNTGDQDASVTITIFFTDREPAGPYRETVGARRTKHVRFNNLSDPEQMPLGIPYASVIESDVPIVVQHTRLDSRAAEIALLSTMAYPVE
ncbi:sensory rhodopsin transducer [Altericroceibacterium xinjiangense]|uniref:sensory rhodopsin transducer n=1 Tax=Altericroceibacterium xinjiangense TaxID=762261 RepID=UPI000F7ED2B1|nr:sensory rhodopsin transducer [Altericroceibacterium xinjiangense]